jgi:hypothetical protein
VRVHAVLTGPTDTDMVQDLDIPKTFPGEGRDGGCSRSSQTYRLRNALKKGE